jgi:spore germination protein KA
MRYVLMIITLLLPGFYIAITSFHHEMIPTELALSITASKEGVPFPSFVEVIFMLIAFEALLEAGLRLPRNISQAVTIVGALVVGEAAVEARLVSPAVVVIISMTAVASFTMPDQDFSNALRLWRFIIVILTSIIGLYGLSVGGLLLLIHLSKMETFGVPYLTPFVATEDKQLQDTLLRLPLSTMYKRPISLKTTNKKRRS